MAQQPMFQNPQKITEIDLGWQKADYVSPSATYENDDKDADPSALSFAWFKVDSQIKPSELEEQERVAAIRTQFEQKVINKYGMPYGSPMPPEVKEMIKEQEKAQKGGGNKWDRKRKRIIDKQIEKDMASQRKKEQEILFKNPNIRGPTLSNFISPTLNNINKKI